MKPASKAQAKSGNTNGTKTCRFYTFKQNSIVLHESTPESNIPVSTYDLCGYCMIRQINSLKGNGQYLRNAPSGTPL